VHLHRRPGVRHGGSGAPGSARAAAGGLRAAVLDRRVRAVPAGEGAEWVRGFAWCECSPASPSPQAYEGGATPNPDASCNRFVKFGAFRSRVLGRLALANTQPQAGLEASAVRGGVRVGRPLRKGTHNEIARAVGERGRGGVAAAAAAHRIAVSLSHSPLDDRGAGGEARLRSEWSDAEPWADAIATGHYASVWPPIESATAPLPPAHWDDACMRESGGGGRGRVDGGLASRRHTGQWPKEGREASSFARAHLLVHVVCAAPVLLSAVDGCKDQSDFLATVPRQGALDVMMGRTRGDAHSLNAAVRCLRAVLPACGTCHADSPPPTSAQP
jgi:hypothetical protein